MSDKHAVYEPEWVIEASGRGGFRVECECGWSRAGFDTVTLARAAAFDHSARGAAVMPERANQRPDDKPPAQQGAPRRRFWGRR